MKVPFLYIKSRKGRGEGIESFYKYTNSRIMATDQSYVREIKSYGWEDLNELWELIISGKTGSHGWGEGRAFEYFIIRAFELSGAEVVYPFETKYHDIVLEQSDGIIYAQNQVYLVECKDQS